MDNSVTNSKGFTFVEILAVVVIMGILSGIAIVGVSKYREKQVQNNYDALAMSLNNGFDNYIMKNGDTPFLKIEDLKEGDFVNNILDPRDNTDCTGYVYKIKLELDDEEKEKYGEIVNATHVDLCCGDYKKKYEYSRIGQKVFDLDSCDEPNYDDSALTEPVPDEPNPTPKTYQIKYVCDNATGVPSNATKKHDVSKVLSGKTPTITGKTFVGWTGSDGKTYSKGQTYSSNKDLTLTCKMDPIKYTVKYVCSGASKVPSAQSKIYGTALTLSSTKPTITGKTFVSWTGNDGNTYKSGDVYKANKDLTLTCKMDPIKYKATFNCSNNGNDNYSKTKINDIIDSTITFPNASRATLSKYYHVVWKDSSGKSYNPGDKYNLSKDTTFTCSFEQNVITVKYYINGGTGACFYSSKYKPCFDDEYTYNTTEKCFERKFSYSGNSSKKITNASTYKALVNVDHLYYKKGQFGQHWYRKDNNTLYKEVGDTKYVVNWLENNHNGVVKLYAQWGNNYEKDKDSTPEKGTCAPEDCPSPIIKVEY